jgi:hypothetical protein
MPELAGSPSPFVANDKRLLLTTDFYFAQYFGYFPLKERNTSLCRPFKDNRVFYMVAARNSAVQNKSASGVFISQIHLSALSASFIGYPRIPAP